MRGLALVLLACASGDDRPLFLRPLAVDWPPHLEKKVDRFESRHEHCAVVGPRRVPDLARLKHEKYFIIAAAKPRDYADVAFLQPSVHSSHASAQFRNESLVARIAPVVDEKRCFESERNLWLDQHFLSVARRVSRFVDDPLGTAAHQAQAAALAYSLLSCAHVELYGFDGVEAWRDCLSVGGCAPPGVVTVEPNRTSITALPKILPAAIWARTETAYVYNPTCFSSNAWFRDLPSKAWTSPQLPADPGAAPLAAIAADEDYSTRLYGAAGAVRCDIVASMARGRI